jgi:hypothetical protein
VKEFLLSIGIFLFIRVPKHETVLTLIFFCAVFVMSAHSRVNLHARFPVPTFSSEGVVANALFFLFGSITRYVDKMCMISIPFFVAVFADHIATLQTRFISACTASAYTASACTASAYTASACTASACTASACTFAISKSVSLSYEL